MSARRLIGLVALALSLNVSTVVGAAVVTSTTLHGTIERGGNGLAGYDVALYSSFAATHSARVLGRATTDASGSFTIAYRQPLPPTAAVRPILFVLAAKRAALLAGVLAGPPLPASLGPVVVNERTTVAAAFSFAQFERGATIDGNRVGMSTDAITRNTGIAVDPSGNVWLANNWKEVPKQRNPGDNAIVVLVGAAVPVQTPVIGTPHGYQ